jgi:lipopolysaccharide export system permease protein
LRALIGYLNYLRENGLDDTVYLAAFWERVVFPLTVLALVLAGMPFVFGAARSQNTGVRLFFGMMLGSIFTILNRMAQNFGEAYGVPTVLTHVLPSLVLAVIAVVALRRTV